MWQLLTQFPDQLHLIVKDFSSSAEGKGCDRVLTLRSYPLPSASHMPLFPRGRSTGHFHLQRICTRLILFLSGPVNIGYSNPWKIPEPCLTRSFLKSDLHCARERDDTDLTLYAFLSCPGPLMHTATWCDSPFKWADRRDAKRRMYALRQCRKQEMLSSLIIKKKSRNFFKNYILYYNKNYIL